MFKGVLLLAAPCGVLAMVACARGYGAWLAYSFVFAVPLACVAPLPLQVAWLLLLRRLGRKRVAGDPGNPPAPSAAPPAVQAPATWGRLADFRRRCSRENGEPTLWFVLSANLLLLVVGYLVGGELRKLSCRRVCQECDVIVAGLDRYQAAHGVYPATVGEVPEFASVSRKSRHSFAQGEYLEYGLSIGMIHSNDATVYLSPTEYVILVSLEHPLPMSFTRFSVLGRSSFRREWCVDSLGWHYSVR